MQRAGLYLKQARWTCYAPFSLVIMLSITFLHIWYLCKPGYEAPSLSLSLPRLACPLLAISAAKSVSEYTRSCSGPALLKRSDFNAQTTYTAVARWHSS